MKFELAAIALSYTSDMLLCRILAYVKSTIVDKLALNSMERYSQEDDKDWCHSDQSMCPSYPTTLEVIRHLASSHWQRDQARHVTLLLSP